MEITSKAIERLYPWVISIIVFLLSWFLNVNIARIEQLPSIMANAITVAAIFIGFMGAMAGIILGSNSKVIQFMKRIGKLPYLLSFIWISIISSFLFLFVSFFIQLFPNVPAQYYLISPLWLSIGTLSVFCTFRGIHITITLISSMINSSE